MGMDGSVASSTHTHRGPNATTICPPHTHLSPTKTQTKQRINSEEQVQASLSAMKASFAQFAESFLALTKVCMYVWIYMCVYMCVVCVLVGGLGMDGPSGARLCQP